MKVYIYGLYDPILPERIRYVGATSNIQKRIRTHTKGNDPQTRPLFDELRKLGRPICYRILDETDEMNKGAVESRWIESFPEPDLFNVRRCKLYDFRVSPIVSMAEMQLKYALWSVEYFGGNKLAASRALGIGRQTLYNMLKRV